MVHLAGKGGMWLEYLGGGGIRPEPERPMSSLPQAPRRRTVARPKLELGSAPPPRRNRSREFWAVVVSTCIHGAAMLLATLWLISNKDRRPGLLVGKFDAPHAEALAQIEGLNDPLSIERTERPSFDTRIMETPELESPITIEGEGAPSSAAEFPSGGGGGSTEVVQGVTLQVGDPQFTLVWDSKADLDLHVEEPGGTHIWWRNRKSNDGGLLDVDDSDGFGPENIYWNETIGPDGARTAGKGPPGIYKWYVRYYSGVKEELGFGYTPIATRWKVRVKNRGKETVYTGILRRPNEQSKVYSVRVGE